MRSLQGTKANIYQLQTFNLNVLPNFNAAVDQGLLEGLGQRFEAVFSSPDIPLFTLGSQDEFGRRRGLGLRLFAEIVEYGALQEILKKIWRAISAQQELEKLEKN